MAEKLSPDEFFTLVEQISSNNESIVSDSENEDERNFDIPVVKNPENNIVRTDMDWNSEGDIPLAAFLPVPSAVTSVTWSKGLNSVIIAMQFSGTSRPNIPDYVETPLDLFMNLFSNELLPSNKDYWSSRADVRDSFIASCMSQNRFSFLLGHIYTNHNSIEPKKGQPGFDKLYKVHPMLDKLSETFEKSYKPTRCQAIDESMIRFKGKISFRQYVSMKPIKKGYKMWVRANDSGFISQCQIYTGKTRDNVEHNLEERQMTANRGRCLSLKEFRLAVANGLIGADAERQKEH
ncbi:hypothetical protein ILUMI_02076 [Ignelater luminosus]|uniref:PiggyBac transposable element-derived protein domain-containing protein n=1 Tax=Ignelater luminosus TaxID=2038154 RepID=A0A8K0DIU7_IGNLU|nr:hypothetical protein ILUMI_02076 [Ignelater luminosus]